MQICQSNHAKQDNGEPIENRFHAVSVMPLQALGKAILVFLMAASVAACEPGVPSGQIVARVDGVDVTQREVNEELRASASLRNQSDQRARRAAGERVINRKILAREALSRSLDLDGRYHFARRRSDDELLLQALRRNIRTQIEGPEPEAVREEILARPWAYERRMSVVLREPDGEEGARQISIDTASVADELASQLLARKVSQTISIDDQAWKVVAMTPVVWGDGEILAFARDSLTRRMIDDELEKLISDYRQSGKVIYRPGEGPSSDPQQ